jgi:hypothetical protein
LYHLTSDYDTGTDGETHYPANLLPIEKRIRKYVASGGYFEGVLIQNISRTRSSENDQRFFLTHTSGRNNLSRLVLDSLSVVTHTLYVYGDTATRLIHHRNELVGIFGNEA